MDLRNESAAKISTYTVLHSKNVSLLEQITWLLVVHRLHETSDACHLRPSSPASLCPVAWQQHHWRESTAHRLHGDQTGEPFTQRGIKIRHVKEAHSSCQARPSLPSVSVPALACHRVWSSLQEPQQPGLPNISMASWRPAQRDLPCPGGFPLMSVPEIRNVVGRRECAGCTVPRHGSGLEPHCLRRHSDHHVL